MAEPSPLLKRKRFDEKALKDDNICIICEESCKEKQKNPNQDQWDDFRENSREWFRIDGDYSSVFGKIEWDSGPSGYLWHKNCKWKMCNKKTLSQATRSFNLKTEASNSFNSEESTSLASSFLNDSLPTRQSTGIIHEKELCVWCMKGSDDKHPERASDLRQLNQMRTWF